MGSIALWLTTAACASADVDVDVAPFLSFADRQSLVMAADGAAVAWTEATAGVANVWFAAATPAGAGAGAWAPQRLTNYKSDDAMDLADLQFVDSGGKNAQGGAVPTIRLLAFTRSPHAGTNPTSKALPTFSGDVTFVLRVHQETKAGLRVDVLGPYPRLAAIRIRKPRDAEPVAASPVPSILSTARGAGVPASVSGWATAAVTETVLTNANASAPTRTTLLGVQQGHIGRVELHPSARDATEAATAFAFESARGDHGFIGLFRQGADTITWVAPSVDTDIMPTWSEDGSKLAWVRTRVSRGDESVSPEDGNLGNRGPDFSVMVADIDISPRSAPGTNGVDGTGASAGPPPPPPIVHNVREVFRDSKYGWPAFGYGNRQLFFPTGRSDVLIFGSEALSGWLHAITVDLSSPDPMSTARELRPGACEDRDWVDGGDGSVLLVSNCQCLNSRGVERVPVPVSPASASTTRPARAVVVARGDLFTAAGMASTGYGTAVGDGGRVVAFLSSTWNAPAAVMLLSRDDDSGTTAARRITNDAVSSPAFNTSRFVRPVPVNFTSTDGRFIIYGQLFVPPAAAAATTRTRAGLPAIVYTHGGSERQVFSAFHYSTTYAQQYAFNQLLASQGMVVLSVNYRSGVGYGHAFRVCDGCQWQGAAEYADVREARLWLGRNQHLEQRDTVQADVDADRIGIWGCSYGGLNALQAVTRDSHLFRAVASMAGVFNWVTQNRYVTDAGSPLIGTVVTPALPGGFHQLATGPEPDVAGPGWLARVQRSIRESFASSPAAHVRNATSPLLLMQGDADEEVDFQELIGIVRALRTAGRGENDVQVVVYPDEAHGLATYAHQMDAYRKMVAFLRKHLLA